MDMVAKFGCGIDDLTDDQIGLWSKDYVGPETLRVRSFDDRGEIVIRTIKTPIKGDHSFKDIKLFQGEAYVAAIKAWLKEAEESEKSAAEV